MSTVPPALPDDAVLVHIGPHKTGTTAIQSTLAGRRSELVRHGVTYPGGGDHHHQPARALRQLHVGWRGDGNAPPDPKVWRRLAHRIEKLPGRVVISSEFFAGADARAREQLVADLGKERIHVLSAARNPASLALSAWQQTLKQGRVGSLDTWLRENFHRDVAEGRPRGFWSGPDPAVLAQRWTEAAGVDRVTVVALEEQDRRLLPSTFEHLLDLPDGLLADVRPPMRNRGLTAAEAEFVRQLNKALKDQLTWPEYNALLRNGVIRRLVEGRTPPASEPKPTLPDWAADVAREESRRVAEALAATGVRIVGDLASLQSIPEGTPDGAAGKRIRVDAAVESVIGAVAAATRGTWRLEADRIEPPVRIEDLSTRELGTLFTRRVRDRARARVRRAAARRAERRAEDRS